MLIHHPRSDQSQHETQAGPPFPVIRQDDEDNGQGQDTCESLSSVRLLDTYRN